MYHKIIIVGNVGRDPEMRYIPSGQAVTNFQLAASRSYTSANGQTVKETIWFRVSVWGKQAEICNNYIRKGRKVLVEGRLVGDEKGNPRTFTRSDGGAGASFEVRADTVRFLDSKAEAEGGGGAAGGMGEDMPDMGGAESEIPF